MINIEDYEGAVKEFSAGIDTFRLAVKLEDLKKVENKARIATICQLYTNRSLCHFMLGNHEKAIEDADSVIKDLDSKNAKSYFRKGLSLAKLGKHDKAVIEILKALSIEPDSELYKNELNAAKDAAKKMKH